jgi:DNA repair protein RecN (Recombination protein N)
MLALKSVLSRADHTPSLIFDEIDQGIGGRLGAVVGEKLWRLSRNHQVFCVTHLAQIASFADTHFRVSKGVIKGRTITSIEKLEREQQQEELMMMLGTDTESGRHSADDLLVMARQVKSGEQLQIPNSQN